MFHIPLYRNFQGHHHVKLIG